MSIEPKRMTFTVTPDMEALVNKAMKLLPSSTRSDVIRALIIAGLDSLEEHAQSEK